MTTTLYALDLTSGNLKTIPLESMSAMYRDANTDTLFVASASTANAMLAGTTRAIGTWQRRVTFDKYETYAWIEVESDFTDADGSAVSAAVTIADSTGATVASVTVSDRTPVRLAPFIERELIVTVVSKARITAVKLASTTGELKQL